MCLFMTRQSVRTSFVLISVASVSLRFVIVDRSRTQGLDSGIMFRTLSDVKPFWIS